MVRSIHDYSGTPYIPPRNGGGEMAGRREVPLSDDPYFLGGDGEPLVLLHGGTATWHIWEGVLPLLTPRHQVLAPTLPGHSGGPQLSGPATIESIADGVDAVMDDMGIGDAHVAGNSLGAWTAMELARRGRARSVVAFSPAGGWTLSDRRVRRFFVLTEKQLRLGRPMLPWMFRSPTFRRLAFHMVAEHCDRLTTDQALLSCRRVVNADFANLLPIFQTTVEPYDVDGIPVLLAWSERDRLLPSPKYSDPWQQAVPTAEWRTLPGVGHIPMIDDPQLVAQTILHWAASAPTGSQPSADGEA